MRLNDPSVEIWEEKDDDDDEENWSMQPIFEALECKICLNKILNNNYNPKDDDDDDVGNRFDEF